MAFTSTRRLFLQGTALTGAAAALTACSQQSAEERAKQASAANEKAVEEQMKLPSTAWERADYDKVADGGTFTVAIPQIPANWNQSHIDGNEVSVSAIMETVSPETPLKADEKGGVELNPDYLTSAELTSEDPQIVTVKYNEKAVWSDGTPVTVDDFISQQKAQNGENEAYQTASTTGWSSIKEIRKINDFEAEIEYAETFPFWNVYLYPSLPKAITATPEAFNGLSSEPPLTRGPFKIDNIDATGGVVTVKRNDKWWGRAPKLETIIFKVTTQQNMAQAFVNGELDMIEIADGDTYGQAKGRKNAVIQKSNGLSWSHLTLNVGGAEGALGDAKVREAIFRSIDRNAVARAVMEPLESPVILVDNFIYMPGQEGYEDSFGGLKFDPEAAQKLLEEAGYKKNGDVYEKDGKPLAFSILIPAEAKSNEDRARQIMTNLNAIGFKVDLKTVPSDKYFDDYVVPGRFAAVTFGWRGTLFAEQSGTNVFLEGSGQNFTGFAPAELTDLNKKLHSELDEGKRKEIANEFSKVQAGAYTVLPFYATPTIIGLTEGFVNVGAAQFETTDWTAVGKKA
ncbi:ABC transporter family substrate-binding protein [Dermabacter sp. HMSC08H10]|uniref:ABC transporter family substrate-binding protein n=1 Tax=Dermabacter sp. HMSC08H10 TaxID=1581144 RepID=UPI0008A20620|nr:ABC transporter family substrate-binding protein [Dermabacter sp. HMSC08H10]OFT20157.1 peptide ABC transporter substrate-binding protein [Dermabacter sp. HMSC08H10]